MSSSEEIPKKQAHIGTKVHVGSLPANVTKEKLMEFFKTFGEILKIELPLTKKFADNTRLNRGYCVVTFATTHSADSLLGRPSVCLEGRALLCSPFKRADSLKKKNKDNNKRRIIIKGIPLEWQIEALLPMFEKFGKVTTAYFFDSSIIPKEDPKDSLGSTLKIASVQFEKQESAINIVNYSPILFLDTFLYVEWFEYRRFQSQKKKCTQSPTTEIKESIQLNTLQSYNWAKSSSKGHLARLNQQTRPSRFMFPTQSLMKAREDNCKPTSAEYHSHFNNLKKQATQRLTKYSNIRLNINRNTNRCVSLVSSRRSAHSNRH